VFHEWVVSQALGKLTLTSELILRGRDPRILSGLRMLKQENWIPAFAGMTALGVVYVGTKKRRPGRARAR